MDRFQVLINCFIFLLLTSTHVSSSPYTDPPRPNAGQVFLKRLSSAIETASHELRASTMFMNIIQNTHKLGLSSESLVIKKAAADCLELLDLTSEELRWVTKSVVEDNGRPEQATNLNAWLSAALTNQETCIDGFQEISNEKIKSSVRGVLRKMIEEFETILSMVNQMTAVGGHLLSHDIKWYTRKAAIGILNSSLEDLKIDLIVAKDGTGNYTSIMEAVEAAVPYENDEQFVIYVKEGKYREIVRIGRGKKNLAIVGDGMQKTIITNNRSAGGGFSTFESATFAVNAPGFMGRDLTFHNGAGPENHQAVAFRSKSDLSICYRCRFEGNQDTLYAHSLRQMYRDCYILGTVDFIFGNAAAAFQNCRILARKPNPGQFNTVTAQKRSRVNETTGFSFHKCRVNAESSLRKSPNGIRTYLGRPWGPYSTTVFMQSYLSEIIDPAGWRRWNGSSPVDKLYYGEYKNSGPGSGTEGRVKWSSYHALTQPREVYNFTAARLIDANLWLPVQWWGLDL
ncbi:probable pectinesterase/pectinesterase inhibitor 32 [Aristolochia californica]|uniref:probable pectinesterase/pectinesterase inhibitor 32 n=1 Tax=Aristolochia californica TaxID=171875 RepID=UPI0035DFCC86